MDPRPHAKRTDPVPDLSPHHPHIQAILRTGFGSMRYARYLLLHVRNPQQARRWLQQMLDKGLVRSAQDFGKGRSQPVREALSIAISYQGLQALGFAEDPDHPFPAPFKAGMASPSREQMFADTPHRDWYWGDRAPDRSHDRTQDRTHGRSLSQPLQVTHLLVTHYRDTPFNNQVSDVQPPDASGFDVLEVRTCPAYLEPRTADREPRAFEPFGFRDGIAQPAMLGFRGPVDQPHAALRGPVPGGDGAAASAAGTPQRQRPTLDTPDDAWVKAGEFVLGHDNEYGEQAYCPNLAGWASTHGQAAADGQYRWAMNGSYMAVRQIWQDVQGFRQFEQGLGATRFGCPGAPASDAPTLAEKLIGRRKDGRPLVEPLHTGWRRDGDSAPTEEAAAAAQAQRLGVTDDFRYRAADQEGFQCPRGSHVRRANPRDALGHDTESGLASARLHRLLRRGRVYTDHATCPACQGRVADPASAGAADPHRCGQGLMFVALNADLDRQFEFVQQRWLSNTRFADLHDEDDPLLGTDPQRAFTVPGQPIGRRFAGLPTWTKVLGGGYFFVPSLPALRFLAAGPQSVAPATP